MRSSLLFEGWIAAVAELFGLPLAQVRDLEPLLMDASCWHLAGAAGLTSIRVPSAALKGAFLFLMRCAPGALIPEHRHPGREVMLVLQGEARELESGALLRPGAVLQKERGTRHSLRVGATECICAVRIEPGAGD